MDTEEQCQWHPYRRYGELNQAGSAGFYWSSSFNPDNDLSAYSLLFGSGYWFFYDYRGSGLSVRAVRP